MNVDDVVFLSFHKAVRLGVSGKEVNQLAETEEWDIKRDGDWFNITHQRKDVKPGFIVKTVTSVHASNVAFATHEPEEIFVGLTGVPPKPKTFLESAKKMVGKR